MRRTLRSFCAVTALWSCVYLSTCLAASAEPIRGGDWVSYNKTFDGQRFSPLQQINVANAANLKEACRIEIAPKGSFQTGLIVVDQTMYATSESATFAIDPTTCAIKWRHDYQGVQASVYSVNRGVAYLNGRLFRGTDDARLLALDAATGKTLWTSVVGDPRLGEFISGVPIAWNGLVVVGTAGSEFGARSRVVAFDALSGREIWRFDTIPLGSEIGADSWQNTEWAKHGGGGTWSTFSLDQDNNEIFVPVGNPASDLAASDRPGANLFTNSVVVLDGLTGRLKWWYQLAPNDGFDHDLGAAPLVYVNAAHAARVAAAGKDGYLHIIDRESHKLIVKVPVTTVDEHRAATTADGTRVCPGAVGGVQWNGPAFNASDDTIFVGAVDLCTIFRPSSGTKWAPASLNLGGAIAPTAEPATGWITAIDADTGAIKWKYSAGAPILGGITSTAGGLVLGGDNAGNFLVLNSANGQVLLKHPVGGAIAGGVITYEKDGRQYIALTSGNSSRTFFGTLGRPSIVVMTLDESKTPTAAAADTPSALGGQYAYLTNCAVCHGYDGKNMKGFDLSTLPGRETADELDAWIRDPKPPMPKVFPEPLSPEDRRSIRDIATYLTHRP